MRLALGIVALTWLMSIAALADGSPTSPDVLADECGPSDPKVPEVPAVAEAKSPLEARIARLEAQLAALETASEAALTAASSAEAARDPMFRVYGFIDVGFQKFWATDDPVIPTLRTFCANYLSDPTGYCTRTGCLTDASLCPDGWTCLDLSMYGYPAICLQP